MAMAGIWRRAAAKGRGGGGKSEQKRNGQRRLLPAWWQEGEGVISTHGCVAQIRRVAHSDAATNGRLRIHTAHSPAQQFTSTEPDWSAVKAVVLAHSTARESLLRQERMLKICGLGVIALACGAGLWLSYLRSDPEIASATLFLALLAPAPLFMVIAAKQRRFQTDFYIAILPLLLPGLDQWSIVTRKPARQIERMPGHYFVPRDEIDCDFHVEGSVAGIPFSITQTLLTRTRGDDTAETTFCGLIVWVQASTSFPGDFAALRRPNRQRSLWQGTALPDRLRPVPNTTHLGRWAYDFVTTDVSAATARLSGLVAAVDVLLTLKLQNLPQIAIRGADIFVLLPMQRLGWNGQTPIQDLGSGPIDLN
ncbi:MAG: hypothetical protein ACK4Z3_16885 [Rhizobium rosettiformans]